MDIWTAAKAGDFQRVKYLVEVTDCDINEKNEFDAIPMFYACLCGHAHIVEYLLSKGAVLEANTFEAERCYYAAHDKEIVDILRNFKAKPKPINMLVECFRTCLSDPMFSDVTFIVQNQEIFVHRYILACRSPYLQKMLNGLWHGRKTVFLKHHLIDYDSFKSLMYYLYTNTLNLEYDLIDSFLLLCKQCKFEDLIDKVLYEKINRNVSDRIILNNEEDRYSLSNHLNCLLKSGEFSDLDIIVEDVTFNVHKDILVCRSQYFASLLTGSFKEASDKVIMNDIYPHIFQLVLEFIYTNNVLNLDDIDTVLNLLKAAEQYLLTDLKKLCINYLVKIVDFTNVYDLLFAADIFNSYKLAETCRNFIAEHFDSFWHDSEFIKFMKSTNKNFINDMKNSIEEYLCHYGYKFKWEKIELQWENIFK